MSSVAVVESIIVASAIAVTSELGLPIAAVFLLFLFGGRVGVDVVLGGGGRKHETFTNGVGASVLFGPLCCRRLLGPPPQRSS